MASKRKHCGTTHTPAFTSAVTILESGLPPSPTPAHLSHLHTALQGSQGFPALLLWAFILAHKVPHKTPAWVHTHAVAALAAFITSSAAALPSFVDTPSVTRLEELCPGRERRPPLRVARTPKVLPGLPSVPALAARPVTPPPPLPTPAPPSAETGSPLPPDAAAVLMADFSHGEAFHGQAVGVAVRLLTLLHVQHPHVGEACLEALTTDAMLGVFRDALRVSSSGLPCVVLWGLTRLVKARSSEVVVRLAASPGVVQAASELVAQPPTRHTLYALHFLAQVFAHHSDTTLFSLSQSFATTVVSLANQAGGEPSIRAGALSLFRAVPGWHATLGSACMATVRSALLSPDAHLVLAAICTVSNLAAHVADLRPLAADAGVLTALEQVLVSAKGDPCLRYSVFSALCGLVLDCRPNQTAVAHSVASVLALESISTGARSPRAATQACLLIARVGSNRSDLRPLLIVHGAVGVLARAIGLCMHPVLQESALLALSALVAHTPAAASLLTSPAVTHALTAPLATVLTSCSPTVAARVRACDLLRTLVMSGGYRGPGAGRARLVASVRVLTAADDEVLRTRAHTLLTVLGPACVGRVEEDSAVRKTLFEFLPRVAADDLPAPPECVICGVDGGGGERVVVTLPCLHQFCEPCIREWVLRHLDTCPCCKHPVLRDVHRVMEEARDLLPPLDVPEAALVELVPAPALGVEGGAVIV